MGRSVSVPYNTAAVAYHWLDLDEEDDADWVFRDITEGFRDDVRSAFPSARPCDYWVGREDHALMENAHAYFGLSEYCGLIAYWIVPKDGPLADSWCQRAAGKFGSRFGSLRKVGTFSNGEAVFERSN